MSTPAARIRTVSITTSAEKGGIWIKDRVYDQKEDQPSRERKNQTHASVRFSDHFSPFFLGGGETLRTM